MAFVHGANEIILEGAIFLHLIAKLGYLVIASGHPALKDGDSEVCDQMDAISVEKVATVVLLIIHFHHDKTDKCTEHWNCNDRIEARNLTYQTKE